MKPYTVTLSVAGLFADSPRDAASVLLAIVANREVETLSLDVTDDETGETTEQNDVTIPVAG